ncbi:unnamed protein product [Polarella glacialis]|uniref:Glycine cleavage system P protein n=1 Tax=Polarella glacialis TaxID=89957 RepID=A0A813K6E3_POLGL|nr:unnamed protein product [Polarella glacialis]
MRAVAANMDQAAGQTGAQASKARRRLQLATPGFKQLSASRGFSTSVQDLLSPTDTFRERHLGPSPADVVKMCEVIGVKSIDELIDQTIPAQVRRHDTLVLPDGKLGEAGSLKMIKEILSKNIQAKNFIGMGYHGTHTPGVILRNMLENPGWYTTYSPYQPEISQGRLESLINFQTLVCELTGMEVANSSLLDEGSAGAEAMAMIARTVNSKSKNQFFISDQVHPQSIDLMKVRAKYFGIELIIGDHATTDFASMTKLCGAMVQYPDTSGRLVDYSAMGEALHGNGAHFVMSADPLALVVAKPPSEFGVDVVVGSFQRFGVPMWFGGPSAAFMACSKKQVRRMPGRLIGESIDRLGNPVYRLALQTREQHIRLDKATSNVCTAQVLLANMSSMYAIYNRSDGLKRIAKRVHGLSQLFAQQAGKAGITVTNSEAFFDTVAMDVSPKSAKSVVEMLQGKGINLRAVNDTLLTASFDEAHLEADMHALVEALKAAGVGGGSPTAAANIAVTGELPAQFARTGEFLQQKIFNSIHSETEMMRYMHTLQLKDLALDVSMISLGSCTMKLNSVSSLTPCSWPEVANMHPFAPESQTAGYRELLESLEKYLISCTGFDACSLQPTSGASGEYAGLLVIRKYLESKGQGHRNVCIIPRSAHGTNPASAAMCDMEIKWIDDSTGMDLEEFKALCVEYKDRLAALMVTYPSTRAFFEDNIQEICAAVHENGGQVYMDGANMNAQLGLTSPGMIGADVCHLNLHKTFSIPHGGGGPGMGPICVRGHLAPHLPNHCLVPPSSGGKAAESAGAVSAAPWGSAGIACIPWMYCTMLGNVGITDTAKYAILNANYMKARMTGHYPIHPTNKHNRCSHEFIMDFSEIRRKTGIVEEDVSKRLQDYGFHAPTMSWPVPHSLMIEPTESEDRGELDRFCDAMIMIRAEIKKIEDGEWSAEENPLKYAPHIQTEVAGTNWTYPYTREEAAFPAPWTLKRGKFWPQCARVDNQLGDRKLKLRLDE